MKLTWMVATFVCIVLAGGLLFFGKYNAGFVVAVIGLVSWFLNYRAQVSSELATQEAQGFDNEEGDDDENQNLENR